MLGCRATETIIDSCKWKTILQNCSAMYAINICITYDPAIALQSMFETKMHTYTQQKTQRRLFKSTIPSSLILKNKPNTINSKNK